MSIQETLQKEIEESKRWLELEDDSTYKRDFNQKNWINKLGFRKNDNLDNSICEIIESKMNEILEK